MDISYYICSLDVGIAFGGQDPPKYILYDEGIIFWNTYTIKTY
jgi:hypothetical protein